MTKIREIQRRRAAALVVCRAVPRKDVREVLDMLGLIPLEPPAERVVIPPRVGKGRRAVPRRGGRAAVMAE